MCDKKWPFFFIFFCSIQELLNHDRTQFLAEKGEGEFFREKQIQEATKYDHLHYPKGAKPETTTSLSTESPKVDQNSGENQEQPGEDWTPQDKNELAEISWRTLWLFFISVISRRQRPIVPGRTAADWHSYKER